MDVKRLLLDHLQDHYELYGEFTGVRSARKHIGWYVKCLPGGESFRTRMNTLVDAQSQLSAVSHFFNGLSNVADRMPDLHEPKNKEEVCV